MSGEPGKLADLLRLEHLRDQAAASVYVDHSEARAWADAGAAYQASLDAATRDAGSVAHMCAPANRPAPESQEPGSGAQEPEAVPPDVPARAGHPDNPISIETDPFAWGAWEVGNAAGVRRMQAENQRLHAACAHLGSVLAWITQQAQNLTPSREALRSIRNAALRAQGHFSGAPRPTSAGEAQGPQTVSPEPAPMRAAADPIPDPVSTEPKPEATGRCQDCKHWQEPETGYNTTGIPGSGICVHIPHVGDATEWRDDAEGKTLKSSYSHVRAFAADSDNYAARLLTLPDFGCTMHEPKPKP